MISEESREAENRYAARNRFEIASRSISASNLILQENHKFENQYRKLQKIAMKQENNRIVDIINENLLPFIKSHNESHVATARQTTAHYESHKNSTASSLKPRGQWIASLVDSGALPTWNWQVRNSKDGPVMGFNKRNAPPELHASIMISELELRKIFNEGQPHNFGSPDPLPPTAVKALVDPTYTPSYVELPVDVFKKFRPGKASIMAQSADTEVLKMPDGSTCAKVKITNSLADGTTETKEFVQKPAELLEEIENARKSMQMMLLGLANMSQGGPDPLRQAIEDITGELERLEGQSLDSPDS